MHDVKPVSAERSAHGLDVEAGKKASAVVPNLRNEPLAVVEARDRQRRCMAVLDSVCQRLSDRGLKIRQIAT